jgi:hypothetical protein
MQKLATILMLSAAAGLASSSAIAQTNSPLTIMRDGGNVAHMFPTYQLSKQLGMVHKKGDAPALPETPALLYHGGPVMHPNLRFYVVFWQPPTLQDGSATTIPAGYKTVEANMVGGYEGHALGSISAQYYQQVPPATKPTYITGVGGLSAVYIDTQPIRRPGVRRSLVRTASPMRSFRLRFNASSRTADGPPAWMPCSCFSHPLARARVSTRRQVIARPKRQM